MASNLIVFITGRKGSGKTYRANRIVQAVRATGQRVVVIAPMGGFDVPGGRLVRSIEDLCDCRDDRESLLILPDSDDLAHAACLYAYTCGHLWLVVDEIDLYLSVLRPVDEYLLRTVRYGRHRGLSLIGVSQRPANVYRDLTAQADYLVCFQSSEPRDVTYLSTRLGPNAGRLPDLPRFKALVTGEGGSSM